MITVKTQENNVELQGHEVHSAPDYILFPNTTTSYFFHAYQFNYLNKSSGFCLNSEIFKILLIAFSVSRDAIYTIIPTLIIPVLTLLVFSPQSVFLHIFPIFPHTESIIERNSVDELILTTELMIKFYLYWRCH